MLGLHTSAIENFNKRGEVLCTQLQSFQHTPTPPVFQTERFISGELTEKDIVGDICSCRHNRAGNLIEQTFYHISGEYGFPESEHLALTSLAKSIHKKLNIKGKISLEFLEIKIFDWVKKRFLKLTHNDLTSFLSEVIKLEIETLTIWVPIAYLEIEASFKISNSLIQPLTKETIDEWEKQSLTETPKLKDMHITRYNQIRKKHQGLAVIITTIEAESIYAEKHALEETNRIVSILSIFSPGTIVPYFKNLSRICGTENVARATMFETTNNELISIKNTTIDNPPETWVITKKDLNEMYAAGLASASQLLSSESLTPFEKDLLHSLFLYSKATFVSEPIEKIVYCISALESLLLRNSNEPISQNLSERVAFSIGSNATNRKDIIKAIKGAYILRSKYLHHGQSRNELETTTTFLQYTCVFFLSLLQKSSNYNTKDDFLNAIEHLKLS